MEATGGDCIVCGNLETGLAERRRERFRIADHEPGMREPCWREFGIGPEVNRLLANTYPQEASAGSSFGSRNFSQAENAEIKVPACLLMALGNRDLNVIDPGDVMRATVHGIDTFLSRPGAAEGKLSVLAHAAASTGAAGFCGRMPSRWQMA
jgi:hypothetical protein